MNISNIFKMEFYRNFRDRAYLMVTGILALLSLLVCGIWVYLIQTYQNHDDSAKYIFGIALFLTVTIMAAIWVFTVIYPYHLLSVDYNNKVLALVAASGVKRRSYYLVKVLATILTSLLAYLVIMILPMILFYAFYFDRFLKVANATLPLITGQALSGQSVGFWLTSVVVTAVTNIVVLYFAVILLRGRFLAIFLAFAFNMGIGLFSSIVRASLSGVTAGQADAAAVVTIVVSVLALLLFGFLGLNKLSKQDL
ncbi:hypothetical protein [Lactococcus termiticola]|uniref:ABC transporter permease protein n=1 Tax=Lactococcus termiticola TaxID=2169526 RepID=A0A2R5HL38_9LACT|nr:hypothetical protein [Lactococcus termiticola]GBG97501.1 hypothetical protein NtB2_01647 [Lactococcus termiticola]